MIKDNRTVVDFQSKDEYTQAMVEDLSDWLNYLYNLQGEDQLTPDNFFRLLKNGVILCKHAQVIQSLAETYIQSSGDKGRCLPIKIGNQTLHVPPQPPTCTIVDFSKTISAFFERDNVSNFILWCKKFNIPQNLTFETEDLVGYKNARNVVVALLEVSRIGRLFGMEVPDIIQLEQEIEEEINEVSVKVTKEEICENVVNHNQECMDIGTKLVEHNGETSNEIKKLASIKKRINNGNKLSNNSSSKNSHNSKLLGRRSSANITSPVFLPKDSLLNSLPNEESLNLSVSLRNNNSKGLRKSQSVCFNNDSSDNESNFSQSSRTEFKIPKHSTTKPVGRVKIYDKFNQLNYVKEKKTREKVDLRSLDERVREVLSQCRCEEMFPMKRISEGKYQYGDKNTGIFVRILRTHVMVRVGGGWDTLGDFFIKHDPCRKDRNENYKFCLPAQSKMSMDTCLIAGSDEGCGQEATGPDICDGIKNDISEENDVKIKVVVDAHCMSQHVGEKDEIVVPEHCASRLPKNVPLHEVTMSTKKPPKVTDPLKPRRNVQTVIQNPKTTPCKYNNIVSAKSRPPNSLINSESASATPKRTLPMKK